CSACRRPGDSPAMVVTDLPCTLDTGVRQENVRPPSMCTMEAPHCPAPQPYLVPVSLSSSRSTHRRGVPSGAALVTGLPLTVKVMAMKTSPDDAYMLHRRHLAVQPDVDARRCERAVGLALRDGEDRRAGLELAAVRGRVGHHYGLRRHQDLLLAALVLHAHDAVVRHLDDVGDVRIGHLAVGPEIPVVVPFPCAAHVLGKDVDFLGDQRAFALAHGRGADELAAGDVVDARLRDPHHHEVVGGPYFHALAVAGLYGQGLAVERLDRPPGSQR